MQGMYALRIPELQYHKQLPWYDIPMLHGQRWSSGTPKFLHVQFQVALAL